MALKAALMVVVLGVALADTSDPYSVQPVHSSVYKQPGMPHNFAYNVRDDYSRTNFGHSENSDGNTVRGSYNVDLPDGRKQTVNYEADHNKGFTADVQYSGEAHHPRNYKPPVTYNSQPSYQHTPSHTTPYYPK
ncbi:cuticle protein 7-like [Procambarus clarkii]|uniref:cuticle protein 7-like n=1 Tax=Procambarus clarkii TaxID=6728 RepID=UPI001E672F4F|nr:cuticle protein 8-like [Procambarus clarkii]